MPEITGQTSAAAPYRIDTQLHQLLYKQPSDRHCSLVRNPKKLPDPVYPQRNYDENR